MPITDISSYVTTADEFIAHWTDVDADRVANSLPVLVVQGGFGRTVFSANRDTLQAAIVGLEGLGNCQCVDGSVALGRLRCSRFDARRGVAVRELGQPAPSNTRVPTNGVACRLVNPGHFI